MSDPRKLADLKQIIFSGMDRIGDGYDDQRFAALDELESIASSALDALEAANKEREKARRKLAREQARKRMYRDERGRLAEKACALLNDLDDAIAGADLEAWDAPYRIEAPLFTASADALRLALAGVADEPEEPAGSTADWNPERTFPWLGDSEPCPTREEQAYEEIRNVLAPLLANSFTMSPRTEAEQKSFDAIMEVCRRAQKLGLYDEEKPRSSLPNASGSSSPLVGQAAQEKPDARLRECVEAWPECEEGMYDPRCCRFPKSCSCTVVPGEQSDE